MKNTIRFALSCLLFTIVSFIGNAAQSRFMEVNNLTSSLTTSSVQDERGYIWIGTEYGLNRFDGIDITEYYHEEQKDSSLIDNHINTLFCDNKGRLWIATASGMQVYDSKSDSFITVKFNREIRNPNVSNVIQLVSGKIWVIVLGQGIFEVDPDTMTSEYLDSIMDKCGTRNLTYIHEDSIERVWIGTMEKGILCLDRKHESIKQYTFGESILKPIGIISETERGMIIAAYAGGVWIFDEVKEKFKSLNNQNDKYLHIRDIVRNNEGELIAAAELDGLWKIDEKAGKLTRMPISFLSDTEYGRADIVDLMKDKDGNLWIGCLQRGYIVSRSDRQNIPPLFIYVFGACLLICAITLCIRSLIYKKRKESDERKIDYYVNMAHEIRSPMIMILNPIERLIKNEDDPKTLQALKTAKRNSMRVIRLMNSFLDIRKLDKGDLSLNIREINLVNVINETLETFAYEGEKRNIGIIFEYPYDNMVFRVDPDHIDTIVFNLVSTVMANVNDSGEVKVLLTMSEEYGNIRISVTSSSSHPYRIDTISEVGMNLSGKLAELQNGIITKEKNGYSFTLNAPGMPLDGTFGEKSENIVSKGITGSSLRYRPKKKSRVKNAERILIIENDEEVRNYLEEVLSPIYKIITKMDGESGLRTAITETPDMIITDIEPTGMSGLQIVKKLKNNPNTTHIPILILTSRHDIDEELEILEYGADAYIVKPFNIDILEISIGNILKNRQRIKGKYSGAHQEDRIKTIEVTSNSDKLMMRVMDVINANLDNPELNVEMLSFEVGLSRAQLHRKMKEMTGISTGEFIRNIRLKKAAELLVEKKVNISQVAYIVGFGSQTHFSTAFRKFYGVSPTEYIKNK